MISYNNSLESNVNSNSPRNNQNWQPTVTVRNPPPLPPRPDGLYRPTNIQYPGYGALTYGSYGGGLSSYGSLNSYGSYNMPYSSSMYNSYGGYNSMGMYAPHGGYSNLNDAERRFIQYAEENSKKTFANVESMVRAFSSIAMMLDNTFFAMTSSFRAFLSMADNFGRLRSTFGQIWYSISIFRLFRWLYNRFMEVMGYKDKGSARAAWHEAMEGASEPYISGTSTSYWPTLTFLGVLVSAPYIISKFLPKYEDNSNVSNWKSPGITAKIAYDFTATNPAEMSVQANDEIILAPNYIQESMRLTDSGWGYAVSNGKSGLVPLNYIKRKKSLRVSSEQPFDIQSVLNNEVSNKSSTHKNILQMTTPVLRSDDCAKSETKTKRVSFGENQFIENIGLEDVIRKAEDEAKQYRNSSNDVQNRDESQKDSNQRLEGSAS